MADFAFCIPVIPGKEELDRATLAELQGSRRADYETALREAGITRQAIWHQATPDGTVAVVHVEAEDPQAAVAQFGSSGTPINAWFRAQMQEVHGLDISQVELQAEKVHDVRV